MKKTSTATNHLWISEPTMQSVGKRLSGWFSTHPPIDDRIAKLRGMG